MPVSVKRSPFDEPAPAATSSAIILRTPQARVLAVLMPTNPTAHPINWPCITRAQLGARAGYTATSGTVTRALNGVREGSSSCEPHKGLLSLGLIEEIILDIDGVSETNYQITSAGIEAYLAYTAAHKTLPALRDASICTNDRYKKV